MKSLFNLKGLTSAVLAVSSCAIFTSCSKDHNNTTMVTPPTYTIPTTYNFANVNYSAQTNLLIMADSLINAINTANATPNHVVTADRLNAIFNNSGSPFNNPALDNSGLKLSDYFPAAMKTDMMNYFDSVALYSQSTAVAASGVAGVAPSVASPTKLYLLSPTGKFYSQIAKKAVMGMCAFQIANVYMKDSVTSTTDTTKLGHYWDAAFGFFGVPANFPTNTTGLKYFGSYSNQVTTNEGWNANAKIMNAFLAGRAAISNSDIANMKVQAKLLISTFDSLDAACIVQEMNESITNVKAADPVATYGTMSESFGFVRNLTYNTSTDPVRVITNDGITQLEQLYDNANPTNPNFYNFVGVAQGLTSDAIIAKFQAIEKSIGATYGFPTADLPDLR